MSLLHLLYFIIDNLEMSYDSKMYLKGYLDGLHICNSNTSVEEFGNPFFIKLYEKLKDDKIL